MSAHGSAIHFVLGTGRCGSTVAHELLCQHPDVAFLSNMEDRLPLGATSGRINRSLYGFLPPSATRKGRIRFAPSEGYRAISRDVSPVLVEPFRDLLPGDVTPWLSERFAHFFHEHARSQGRPVFLHKFTGWPRARFIQTVLPESRFVHVVRDGRAVANSWLQMTWWRGHLGPPSWHFGPLSPARQATWENSGRSLLILAGLAWDLLIEAAEEARDALKPGTWLDIRYEDLVAAPDTTLGRVRDFLGLPANSRFAERLSRQALTTNRTDAFRRDLTPGQVAALEEVLGQRLVRWGYKVAGVDSVEQE